MAGFALEGIAFAALFCETLFYGAYAILFSCTIFLWFIQFPFFPFLFHRMTMIICCRCRKPKSIRTKLGIFIRIPTVLMFALSTIDLVLAFVQDYRVFVTGRNDPNALGNEGNRYIVVQLTLNIFNVRTSYLASCHLGSLTFIALLQCILADLILTWRAWALFNRNAKVLIAPLLFILGSTVMGCVAMSQIAKWTKVDGQNPSLNSIFSPAVAPWIYAMS
ncbi:hypothetical protein DL96DRAFT_233641 [Flagelloscypha sp. PMI_526]|nr:hypothetical protein DL96DRAFT_233641 [Flagelloscypha sp. PMI_526]